MYRLAFFGTSTFAVPLVRALAADPRFSISVVVTQPDRPVGRKQVVTASPVKELAVMLGLSVFQPEQMKAPEAVETLRQYAFDAAVVASYGQILSQAALDLAPNKFINLHGSILPAYRGASPIAEAIKQGEHETGVTVMLMDAQMDHGAMLATATCPILDTDTTETLEARMAELGAATLPTILAEYLDGKIVPTEQPHEQATFCKLIKKEDGFVDTSMLSAAALDRLVRAYTPWPNVTIEYQGARLKLLKTHVGIAGSRDLSLPCKEGTLIVDECRPEGGKTMTGEAFLRGRERQSQ